MSEYEFEQTLLERAFQRGYMSGRMGMDLRNCPYKAEPVQAAWQSGWRDGRVDAQHNPPIESSTKTSS